MDLIQISSSQVKWGELIFTCAVGENGFIAEQDKCEGDSKTPCGAYNFLRVYYRPDRVLKPQTKLPVFEITRQSAWCDDINHVLYNKYFNLTDMEDGELPSHEKLWRDDHLYDILVVVDHNYTSVSPNKGSAVFVHCTHAYEEPPFRPSLGCLKLFEKDLVQVLKECEKSTKWVVPVELSS